MMQNSKISRSIVCWVLVFIAFAGLAAAQSNDQPAGSQSVAVIKRVLDNGLTIIIKPNPANEVISVNTFLRMGAIYEQAGTRGISKIMQRVLIKGTSTRNAKDIVLETESVGAELDSGISGFSYGSVSLKTTLGGFDAGLKVYLDVLTHPAFPAAEIAKEKEMMIQDLAASEDQPVSVAYQNYLSLFYSEHSIGIGPDPIAENVKKLTRDDIVAWYHKIYTPANMVISIVGKVDPDSILKVFSNTFAAMPRGEVPAVVSTRFKAPETERTVVQKRESQALFMVFGYPAPDIQDGDYPVMEVISYILGGDMGSRLFVELREKKGLAYNVSTENSAGDYPSNIFAFIATEPSNYRAAKDGIIREFERLTRESLPADELAEAKQALKGSFLMSHETNASQGAYLGSYELLGPGYGFDAKYPGLIDKVTVEDIQRVAKLYFKNYTLSVVSPIPIEK